MRVPEPLSTAFGQPFQELISRFATDQKLMPEASAIESPRFLARSVVPHIEKLSGLFNRLDKDKTEFNRNARARTLAEQGLDPYWKESSNPKNLRLAYFLYFMPSNLYRVASVVAELGRLGYRWSSTDTLRALELGAGPASGACGVAAGERFGKIGIPRTGNWALIEQDKPTLELGARWAAEYFNFVTQIQKPPEAKAVAPHESEYADGEADETDETDESFEDEAGLEEGDAEEEGQELQEFDEEFMDEFDREFNSDEESGDRGQQVEDDQEKQVAHHAVSGDPAHQDSMPAEAESVQPFDWGIRTFHRTIDFKRGLLPPGAPKFNLWVGSYFLNESALSAVEQANLFLDSWEKHLEEEGLVIM
ncbi:MAG: hypothetical protein H7222_04420, partial [Methylotenera sp.]|nr:hypothetical protein [Oligoflexia bacterium]